MNKPDDKTARRIECTIRVTPHNHPDLFNALGPTGRYYRSRRLLQLASIGLAVEEGRFPALTLNGDSQSSPQSHIHFNAQASSNLEEANTVSQHLVVSEPAAEATHYSIPDDAADALDGLFSTMA